MMHRTAGSAAHPLERSATTTRGRVLVAEDEDCLAKVISRALTRAGFEVEVAPDGKKAAELLAEGHFDVVLSDIDMPALNGVQLLRVVRERHDDVPVILMTGAPDLASAIESVGLGASDYLVKPVSLQQIEESVARANLLHRMARLKRDALDLVSDGGMGASDRSTLEASFDRTLGSMWMAYQPIVSASDRTIFGYEALMRSQESALPHPGAILDAAERLNRMCELGRRTRSLAIGPMSMAGNDQLLFVNLHASDLMDDVLLDPQSALSSIAARVVLEITERATLDEVKDARTRIAELRRIGFRIAIDDLGAGYSGLTSFAAFEPEFVKLDMSLVRDIDSSVRKQKLVRSMISVCHELGATVVAEGIETPAERDTTIEMGADLLQGYLFAKPGKAFPQIVWGKP